MNKYIIFGMMLLFSMKAVGKVDPNVTELMQKSGQTQDKWQSSFISKIETKEICTFRQTGFNVTDVQRNHIYEFRWDGDRMKMIKRSWGWTAGGKVKDENNKSYNSWMFDGENFYSYVNGLRDDKFVDGYPGKGFFDGSESKDRTQKTAVSMIHTNPLLGYPSGSVERLDKLVIQDTNAFVQDNMQKIGEFQCYVIESQPVTGAKVKLWIDPQHGYNIVKYEYRLGEGFETARGNKFKKTARAYNRGTVLNFKKIDDIWVPMEMDYYGTHGSTSETPQKIKAHYKQTEFTINPDHNALGSFKPDDIQNGATIWVPAHNNIRYKWQDGAMVDKEGKVFKNTNQQIKGKGI